MSVEVVCNCGEKLAAPEKLRGKCIKCPKCSSPILIPAAADGSGANGGHQDDDSTKGNSSSSVRIKVRCGCGKSVAAGAELAGKTVKCPSCRRPLRIPSPSIGRSASGRSAADKSGVESRLKTDCPCGKSIEVPRKYAGKSVQCPACKQPLSIPAVGENVAPLAESDDQLESLGQRSLADDWSGVGLGLASLFEEEGVVAVKPGLSCPKCRAEIDQDDVLCVQCGYHMRAGKQLVTKVHAEP